MSHIQKAFDAITLAAAEDQEGIGGIARKAGVNVDTARRIMRTKRGSIEILALLEGVAIAVLGDRSL